MNKQLFFCFGIVKSGTTFLQRTLNLHPEISCPAEHNFDFLLENYKNVLVQYQKKLQLIDRRTGGQGVIPISEVTLRQTFRTSVESIIYGSAGEKRIAGANDNAIINKIDFYNELFRSPKLIVIFRHPVDAALSAWHHNLKLAEEENNRVHVDSMERHGGLEGLVKNYALMFSRCVPMCLDFGKRHGNLLIIRYEDLKNDKRATLERLFGFLGAATDTAIIDEVIANSSLEVMKERAVRKEFFRSGSTAAGEGAIADDVRRKAVRIAAPALQALGYDSSDGRTGSGSP